MCERYSSRSLFRIVALVISAAAVSAQAQPTDLFISEYIEGTSFNKAIEIYNGTGASVDLSAGGYSLELYSNGAAAASQTLLLNGVVNDGDVAVIAHASANAAILNQDDIVNSSVINFNGDDAVALKRNGAVMDAGGQVGVDPGSSWSGGGISTANQTLRRQNGICEGDANAFDSFDPSIEWIGFPVDTFDGLGANIVDCGAVEPPPPPLAKIHDIQGSGPSVTGSGPFTVEAIVIGDYQGQAGINDVYLDGFLIQEEDADIDGNSDTSEGIFVYCQTCPVDVQVGDKVSVTGAASDFFGMSQLTAISASAVTLLSSGNPLPTPALLQLPVPIAPVGDLPMAQAQINAYYERVEGMLVTVPDVLTVAEYFQLFRYGQLVLTQGGRIDQFTDANAPSVAGYVQHQIEKARRVVLLDDDNNVQNFSLTRPVPVFHPLPGFSVDNYVRGGDTISNLTGVLHWSFAGQSGTDAWRIRPVPRVFSYAFVPANPRPAAPAVAGEIKVASFNVLNYFNGDGLGGGFPTSRGADSAAELVRQRDKIVAALIAMDADIVGLMEIENDGYGPTSAIAELVNGLNAAAGADTYAFVDVGVPVIGSDEIAVGLLYKPAVVTPVGNPAVLDSSVDPAFLDTKNRPVLAQTFAHHAHGGRLTVAVNHLKSKGSDCNDVGDVNTLDGQGHCNGTRTAAAQALVNWLATDPTDSGDEDRLIIGDLNAYAKEDPVTAIKSAGYIDLLETFQGANAYSYVFDGELGYLDHALANASLAPQVVAAQTWTINADEVNLLDYNDTVVDVGESSFEAKPAATPLYAADAYRSSDHDPVLIGLNLTPGDSDGDGVTDDLDQCAATASGEVVDSAGCSIAQLVPCAGPLEGGAGWRNHGQYVRGVARTAERFLSRGLITLDERDAIVAAAARSVCG